MRVLEESGGRRKKKEEQVEGCTLRKFRTDYGYWFYSSNKKKFRKAAWAWLQLHTRSCSGCGTADSTGGSGRGIPVLFELERGGCCRFEHMAPCQNEGPLTSRRLMLCFSCRTHRGSDDRNHASTEITRRAQQAGDE